MPRAPYEPHRDERTPAHRDEHVPAARTDACRAAPGGNAARRDTVAGTDGPRRPHYQGCPARCRVRVLASPALLAAAAE
ncbi:hypothetical protein [Streptomyces sp. x-80]|jgi:hypothetical protein|uniref:hypothetical protein n=1 Tax=Streptomyces sp. x-80 TaxID=2789282 RepID=UPI00397F8620